MSQHEAEKIAEGFVAAYIRRPGEPDYSGASDSLAYMLRASFLEGLRQGADKLSEEIQREIASNGPLTAQKLMDLMSKLRD
ncbi:hypothetical protein [uncultured Xanthomonas sp.]|uniref:hypothetical protein n=1 Tax=uncultured Xanthomonas sp. TaxID=152831 RepID=UPI0025DAE6D2|nr:hypothetical protein [uncultured Xanthomonas sp.]